MFTFSIFNSHCFISLLFQGVGREYRSHLISLLRTVEVFMYSVDETVTLLNLTYFALFYLFHFSPFFPLHFILFYLIFNLLLKFYFYLFIH